MSEVVWLTARYIDVPDLSQNFWNISWRLKNKEAYFYQLIVEPSAAKFVSHFTDWKLNDDEAGSMQHFDGDFMSWFIQPETAVHQDFVRLIQTVQGIDIIIPFSAWVTSAEFQQSYIPKE